MNCDNEEEETLYEDVHVFYNVYSDCKHHLIELNENHIISLNFKFFNTAFNDDIYFEYQDCLISDDSRECYSQVRIENTSSLHKFIKLFEYNLEKLKKEKEITLINFSSNFIIKLNTKNELEKFPISIQVDHAKYNTTCTYSLEEYEIIKKELKKLYIKGFFQ